MKQQYTQMSAGMSAAKVNQVLLQKVNEFEDKSKIIEKSFVKREMSTRDFTESYVKDRKQYHRY